MTNDDELNNVLNLNKHKRLAFDSPEFQAQCAFEMHQTEMRRRAQLKVLVSASIEILERGGERAANDVEDLWEKHLEETAPPIPIMPIGHGNWDHWKRSHDEPSCLRYQPGEPYDSDGDYQVSLEITSAAQALKEIAKVSNQRWASDACIAGLVRALDDLIGLDEMLLAPYDQIRLR